MAAQGGAKPHINPNNEPWYKIAQEAAQILVSALVLYASVRAFLEKIKKRRELTRRE